MELWRLGVLRGPNRWAACPILEASVEWNRPRPPLKLVVERLRAWLPSLEIEGSSLDEVNNLAVILERLTLHLQIQAGQRVSFAQTRPGDRLGRYLVAVEYQHEAMGKACLQTAIQMCRAALLGQPIAVAEEMEHLRQLAEQLQSNPSQQDLPVSLTVAVAGSRRQTVGRCLAALLTECGLRVGRASTDGVFLAGRRVHLESATAYDKARAVLNSGRVEVAILEVSADDLRHEGLGCACCDVVLLTDSPGRTEAEAEDACAALFHALTPHSRVVLHADDPPPLGDRAPVADRIFWFASDGENERIAEHRAAGGSAVYLCADSLVVARGVWEQRLSFGGRPVEREPREQLALLAALAGAMSMNQCGDEKPVVHTPPRTRREMMLSAR